MEDQNTSLNFLQIFKKLKLLKIKKIKLDLKTNALLNEIQNHITELQLQCPHINTTKQHKFIPGGYYDRSEEMITTKCNMCDKILSVNTTYGGYS